MKKLLALLCASGMTTLLAGGSAFAQAYPANIIGTWNIQANNTQVFTFTVQAQSADSPCAQITGVIGGPDSFVGYYCPATGLVSFERNSANTGATFQVFDGQLSWAGGGNTVTLMSGHFSNYAGGNNTGAFSFWAEPQ